MSIRDYAELTCNELDDDYVVGHVNNTLVIYHHGVPRVWMSLNRNSIEFIHIDRGSLAGTRWFACYCKNQGADFR